jgi:hypothetical protein
MLGLPENLVHCGISLPVKTIYCFGKHEFVELLEANIRAHITLLCTVDHHDRRALNLGIQVFGGAMGAEEELKFQLR